MKTMKNLAFVILPLLMLVLGLGATIDWTYEDHVPKLGNNATLRKRIEITTNAVSWPDGKKVNVAIGDFANGLGEALGTLSNVTMLGQTFPLIEKTTEVGTTTPTGSWTKGSTVVVGASQSLDFPTHKKKTSYAWSASGWIKLHEDYWKESITIGGTIRIPTAISGTYSTTGTWETKSNPKTTRSAANTNGTHSLVVKYWCSSCSQEGDTATAIGGREAHSEGECPGSDCSVRYRKCTPPVGHKIIVCPGSGCSVEYRECSVPEGHRPCPSCGARECEVSNKASSGCSVCQSTTTPSTSLHPCGAHPITASGDHTQQASCSVTNSRGQSCTVTNFYACQSHRHTYPTLTMPCPRTLLYGSRMGGAGIGGINRRGASVCSKGGYLTLSDNHRSTCRLRHTYWDCDPAAVEQHKARTCARCSNTYQNCQGNSNPCISGRGHSETADPPAEAPSTPQPNPSPSSETPPTTSPEESDTTENEEEETEEEDTTEVPEETAPTRPTAVCGSGHTYFRDVSYARSRHRDRTCTRCSQTYQKCSNHSSACQGSWSHTEDPSATPSPSPPTPSPPTETPSPPTPSPPENSDPDNNENEEEDAEEEVPAAPPAPTISYHPCGVHPTTVSGDHSLQASCSRDSNCIASSFYWCQHSSHEYPAVTLRPCGHPTTRRGSHSWVTTCAYYNSEGDRCTNTSGYYRCKPHTHEYPDPPPAVVCPADKWTDCGGTTSHAKTCSAGHTTYTCNAGLDVSQWEKRHRVRTCRFSECGQTWQACVNGWDAPICKKPYRARNGLPCWEP